MSANRVSWIVAIVVVAVVGLLVVRTLQRDTSIRTASADRPARKESPAPHTSSPPSLSPPPVSSDSIRAALQEPGISSVQKAKLVLQDRGFYKGQIDGNYDPALAEALKRFQAEQGMKATGYLDEKTYEALGIELRHKRP
jgi:peptidoglycan hydrolase-like protein with peptidoglycan-binding domain